MYLDISTLHDAKKNIALTFKKSHKRMIYTPWMILFQILLKWPK